MKYYFIIITLLILSLWGCSLLSRESLSLDAQKIITWNTTSGTNISSYYPSLSVSWNTIISNWLFTIQFPTNLVFQMHDTLGQWRYKERLDLYIDSWKESRKNGYVKVFVENIPDWRKELSNEDKCIFSNYDENIVSKKTIKKQWSNKDIYLTYVTFSAMNNVRKQGDLCFIKNNLIYTVSVWWYDQSSIENILTSFTFLD